VVIRSSSAREVDQLLKDLQSEDTVLREAAVARLRVLGSRVVARLETVLRSGGDQVRMIVLQALEGIDDPRVIDIGLTALTDPNPVLQTQAIATLRPWVARESGTRLMEALVACAVSAEQPADVRAAARDALSELPREIVQPILEQTPPPSTDDLPGEPSTVAAWLTEHTEAPLSSLHALIARLRAGERAADAEGSRLQWLVARGAVHHALARRGSAVALYDLRETFDAASAPLPLDYLHAITVLGDGASIESLGKAWAATSTGDVWWRERVADAAAAIAARLKLTRRHAIIKRVQTKWPGLLH
jgi:hypothetical protein